MIPLEIIGLVILAAMGALLIWQAAISAASLRTLKDSAKKVKVVKKSHGRCYFWVIVAVLNLIFYIMNLNSALEDADIHQSKAYLYLITASIALMLVWTFLSIFDRYAYVTSEGIISVGNPVGSLTPDKVTYRIIDMELEIFVNKSKRTLKYELTGEKQELSDLMIDFYSRNI